MTRTPEEPGDGNARGLLRTLVDRPVTVTVGVILIVLAGGISVIGLPIQVTPDVTTPTLTITTRWPGAAPVEIETDILEPQEDTLKNLTGLVKMESSARPDQGQIELELQVGTNTEEAIVRVTNALSQVPNYPVGARQPVVTTSNASGPPLAVLTITSPDGESPAAYRTWAEERVVPRIERVPGVADALLIGGRDTEVHVDFDMGELAARGLTIPDVAQRVGAELRDVSGGDLRFGKRQFLLRTPVAPERPEELAKVVLGASPEGTPILLGDVATVGLGLREPAGVAMSDDRPSMVILLWREVGTNVLEVTRGVRAAADDLQDNLMAPEGLELQVVSDQVDYISGALDLVQQNLLLGACFAIIVLLLFLRSVGASLIISLAIPVCVFGTALGMTLFGRSVNVVSLAGITFAVGMVLDNSIVALESIDTWRARVASASEAAYRGIQDVWGAILASTLTTAAVFVPIIAWEGEVGQLLRDVAVAISFAVGFSLIVSVIVIPSLAGKVLRPRTNGNGPKPGQLASMGNRFRNTIRDQVAWVTRSAKRAGAVVALVVGTTVLLGLWLVPPLEYLPTGSRNLVFGIVVPPPGYAIEELEAMGRRTQARLAEHTGVAKDGVPAIERSFFVGSPERLFSGAIAEDPRRIGDLVTFMRGLQSEIPGVFAFTNQASLFGSTIGGGRSVEIEISGSDLVTLSELGGRMMGMLNERLPRAQVRPIPSLDAGAPELRAVPRRDETASLRLSAADLGRVVDSLVDGTFVGEYGEEGRPKVDVVLRAKDRAGHEVRDVAQLAMAPVATPSGHVVPLGALAELREELGPTVIRRVERRRAITLEVAPHEEMALEQSIAVIRNDIMRPLQEEGAVSEDVEITLSGTASKLEEAASRLGWVLGLAVVILFLMMAAVFEDFLAPTAVLVTVPLAAAGGILGLRLVDALSGGQPLDLMTSVGFVILLGVVVNNAILVVDGSVARLREGWPLAEAVPEAVRLRVRPIFMTTATSLAGLLPMVVFSGFGSELYRGVGAIVLGGLTLGTLLTIYVVPAVFSLLWRGRARATEPPSRKGWPTPQGDSTIGRP
jgi:hydrophobic/amphiphilic exporter-1 (mainly G- bacteria), HAE1 family